MQSASGDVDVLIVGAGPVGLFLANECARRKLRFRIVESRAGQSQHSKALAIFPRTLEVFDMAGLAGPFLEAANRVAWVALRSPQRTLARLRFAPPGTPYPFVAMVAQDVTERLLVERLARRGGSIEYETAFVSAAQQPDHVQVALDRRGETSAVRATFVVGCDGAHSAVRHALALTFEGAEYADSFMLADIMTNHALPGDEMQICPNAGGPLAIFPMSGTHRRVVAMFENAQGDAPSLELVRETLAQRAPAGLEAESLVWSSFFRIHHRCVSRMSVGRVFLAGDAAHIHSPFGGQGMNTGLQDAWNLVWKLDLALHGHAAGDLLTSYSAERLPVVKRVIEVTDLMTKVFGTRSQAAQAARDTLVPLVSRLSLFQRAFVGRLSGLDNAYRGSPIVEGAGRRYFDESLRGGEGIKSRFTLMLGADANETVVAAATRLVMDFAEVLELRTFARRGIVLLRPDGYTAYDASRSDDAGLRSIRMLLRRQVR
jgi:2-polyprenyl-6-methoxyphenol hydroxylase-like FAD-dependent oxidoreductase